MCQRLQLCSHLDEIQVGRGLHLFMHSNELWWNAEKHKQYQADQAETARSGDLNVRVQYLSHLAHLQSTATASDRCVALARSMYPNPVCKSEYSDVIEQTCILWGTTPGRRRHLARA